MAHRVAAVVVVRRAANFDVVLYLLTIGIVLRDADCFLPILRGIRGAAQLDVAFVIGTDRHPRETRVLLQSRLNLAGCVSAHVALRNA